MASETQEAEGKEEVKQPLPEEPQEAAPEPAAPASAESEDPRIAPLLGQEEPHGASSSQPRKERRRKEERVPLGDYPTRAALYFGEGFAHRLRWAHAVNSRRRLRVALNTDVHFLEADVAYGPMIPASQAAREDAESRYQRPRRRTKPSLVSTASGETVIMAHYPTESSSDLSLDRFINAVLRHNECIASERSSSEGEEEEEVPPPPENGPGSAPAENGQKHWKSAFSEPVLTLDEPEDGEEEEQPDEEEAEELDVHHFAGPPQSRAFKRNVEEAEAFAQHLHDELEVHAAVHGRMLTACVGSRRDQRPAPGPVYRRSRKGVKLDFKLFDCVEPSLRYLRDIDAARKLRGHLWLNADIFAGPGALISPMDAQQFVKLCAELLPEAVLSLSWGSSVLSATRLYTHDMVDRMIELCMSPIVPRAMGCSARPRLSFPEAPGRPPSQGTDKAEHPDESVWHTPAASCQHITFAVAAEYSLSSSRALKRLLDAVPGTSLTIFSGVGSLGITPQHVQELITTYGKTRLFLDLRVSKPWRSCAPQNPTCSVQ